MSVQVNGIIGFIILALDIVAILKTIQSSASVAKKTVWILIILFLPLLGLILWYFFSPRA